LQLQTFLPKPFNRLQTAFAALQAVSRYMRQQMTQHCGAQVGSIMVRGRVKAGTDVMVLPGIDTIDISDAVPKMTTLSKLTCSEGHSYLTGDAAVLSDLHELITYDASPSNRHRLEIRQKDGIDYWTLRAAVTNP
jgi:hypothetical protein